MKIEMELQVGIEPMTLGSPTSPKPTPGAQFLPGFLMGDLPSHHPPAATFQPGHLHDGEPRNTPSGIVSAPLPFVPTPKDKSGAPPVRTSASYILLQFAQYGNILKHTMASPCNWMHLQYQSSLQARKALSKDGKCSETPLWPLSAGYKCKAAGSDYQVLADRQTPRKDDSMVSKAMEYMFGW
ncbi:hypothetical protein F7725_002529 [Dissostichus mawsoni]|uniref:Nucleoporin NUP35 n=1 Tax=Dissostichus mawsoni TaxID=36200 RepID=A0A7J5Y2T7_DISMA|nr:hypothetical protein F7725_002529 [Dissostichus mawsoni]